MAHSRYGIDLHSEQTMAQMSEGASPTSPVNVL